MGAIRKMTMNLPADLVDRAQAASGKNATETVKLALEAYAQARAYEEVAKLRGKVKFSLTWQELKGDYE